MSQLTKVSSAVPFLSTQLTTTTILDWLKPQRSEAIARLRTNALGLLTLAILTNLLPVPSLWTAVDVLRERRRSSTPYYGICALEVLLLAVLAFNVLQASYALKYPRTQLPPPPLPSPAKIVHSSPTSRQRRLNGLSPNSSPQPQKSFSYVSSPVSTPSRIINYTIPPSASTPLDASFTSSFGSVPSSPASPLAAYRGRYSATTGRAFDGSLLSRLAREDSDDDEDDEE